MNIFYSWQSDTPNKIGRDFVKRALDDAVDQLSIDMQLVEADRPNIDQDTKGVLGSPAIAETIFEKIRNSSVVVLDVTLVCRTENKKSMINSNVAYELGFAHGVHGDEVLLTVMNTFFGGQHELPFDLAHRRWPLSYELAPDATAEQRQKVRSSLSKELSKILKLYFEATTIGATYVPNSPTYNRACYWQERELLVDVKGHLDFDEPTKLGYSTNQSLAYLRVWPDMPLPEFSGTDLRNYGDTSIAPMLERFHGGQSHDRNRYGTITYAHVGRNKGELIATSQVFKTREIWGTEGSSFGKRDENGFKYVPMQVFETGMIRSLCSYLKAAFERFEYKERARVEAGLVNINEHYLAMPNNYRDSMWGPIYGDICVEGVVEKADEASSNAFLLKLFESVFDAAGHSRPVGLHDFPTMT
jgi:hypothetical protein